MASLGLAANLQDSLGNPKFCTRNYEVYSLLQMEADAAVLESIKTAVQALDSDSPIDTIETATTVSHPTTTFATNCKQFAVKNDTDANIKVNGFPCLAGEIYTSPLGNYTTDITITWDTVPGSGSLTVQRFKKVAA